MKNRQNLIRITTILLLLPLLYACAASSGTRQNAAVQETTPLQEKELPSALAEIRKLYEPVPCFDADFNVTIDSRREGRQNGRGRIYGDNVNDRMQLTVTDAVIGIVISKVIVSGGLVYIDTIGERPQLRPLSDFVTGNVSRNAIPLPFAAFRNMIMGRIPDAVFSKKGIQENHDKTLRIVLSEPEEDYYYDFIENRLRKMTFVSKKGGYVMIDLEGQYPDTPFPQTIYISSRTSGGSRDLGENLRISFRSINTETAQCADPLFVIPGLGR